VLIIDCSVMLTIMEDLGKVRPLNDVESGMVEEIVVRETTEFRWNDWLDLQLQTASKSNGGIKRFADRHAILPHCAHARLYRLRNGVGRNPKGRLAHKNS
jgi:hypothetical protein